MKRIETSGAITAPHFIGAWTIEPSEICDDLIEFFEKHTAKQKQGEFSSGVDPLLKKSIDITIKPKDFELKGYEVFSSYILHLFRYKAHRYIVKSHPLYLIGDLLFEFLVLISLNLERN